MKNSKKFKMKKIMLFAVAPLAVCGISGIATGVAIAVANDNTEEKTDIKTVFSKLTSVWKEDVSIGSDPVMTNDNCFGGAKFQGEGLREGAKNVIWSKDSLLYYLQQQINTVDEDNKSMVNELTVTFQNNYDKNDAYNKWQEVTLAAMQHSTNYTGSVKFYFYLDKTDQIRSLSEDFTNTDIDMTTDEYANNFAPSNAQILKAIKDKNENLNTNSVHIQYCLNISESTPTWTDWAEFDESSGSYKTARQAGVNGADAEIAENWKSLWNTNGYYGRKTNETTITYALRLIPNPQFSVYSQEPNGVEFTIVFTRPFVYDDENWQSGENIWSYSNSHQYIVDPDTGNFKTTFTQYYSDIESFPFFEKLNTITDSWYFKKTTKDNKLYAQIVMNQSNPYYASLSDSLDTSNTKLFFEYTLLNKIDFKSTYETLIPEGGLEFYTDPSDADIISFFEYKISQQTDLSPIFWQEVTIAIDKTNKKITLSVPNSLHYQGDPLEIAYRLNQ